MPSIIQIDSAPNSVLSNPLRIGDNALTLMLGPCAVESYEQTRAVAAAVSRAGVRVLRGGAFKPRTSPHTFQGLGLEGLEILRAVADEFGLLVITEALGVEQLPLVSDYADIIQIGSRNMQHYPLLWAAAETGMPIMLKRGFMSTVAEWLAAADHIISRGNERIMLCERGIRSFDNATRNVLDVGAIALLKTTTGFPVIADPSHAVGRSDLVLPAAKAAIAAGADGLIVEFHPDPPTALSDAEQAISADEMDQFVAEIGRIAVAVDRHLPHTNYAPAH